MKQKLVRVLDRWGDGGSGAYRTVVIEDEDELALFVALVESKRLKVEITDLDAVEDAKLWLRQL